MNEPSMLEGAITADGLTPNEVAAKAEAMFTQSAYLRGRALKFWPRLQSALHARLIATGHPAESYAPFEHGVRFIYLTAITQGKTAKQAYNAGIGAIQIVPPCPRK